MSTVTNEVRIPLPDGRFIDADLDGPEDAPLVVFAHGSGSSRHSPRNKQVAATLNDRGLRTLLLDLLTSEEEREDVATREHRFDIQMLGDRVGRAVDWSVNEFDPPAIGLFGASTGAAAAIVAASGRRTTVDAVVSRGGRPDLAADALDDVDAPTLLIVGSLDRQVLRLNEEALARLGSGHSLEVVEGASHLFEEIGALDRVADLAADWFVEHLIG